jgi:hypothetical protein
MRGLDWRNAVAPKNCFSATSHHDEEMPRKVPPELQRRATHRLSHLPLQAAAQRLIRYNLLMFAREDSKP